MASNTSAANLLATAIPAAPTGNTATASPAKNAREDFQALLSKTAGGIVSAQEEKPASLRKKTSAEVATDTATILVAPIQVPQISAQKEAVAQEDSEPAANSQPQEKEAPKDKPVRADESAKSRHLSKDSRREAKNAAPEKTEAKAPAPKQEDTQQTTAADVKDTQDAAPVAEAPKEVQQPAQATGQTAAVEDIADELKTQMQDITALLQALMALMTGNADMQQALAASSQQSSQGQTTLVQLKLNTGTSETTNSSATPLQDVLAKGLADKLQKLQDLMQQKGADLNATDLGALGKQDSMSLINQLRGALAAMQKLMKPETAGQVGAVDDALQEKLAQLQSLLEKLDARMNATPLVQAKADTTQGAVASDNTAQITQQKLVENVLPQTAPEAANAAASMLAQPMQDTASKAQALPQGVQAVSSATESSSGSSQAQQGGADAGDAFAKPSVNGSQMAGAGQEIRKASDNTFSRMLSQMTGKPAPEQVIMQIKTMKLTGDSKIEIRLDPAELGRVHIKLTVGADGKTGMSIMADNQQTLELLQKESRALQQALSDAGLKTDAGSLSFNLQSGQQEHRQEYAAASSYVKAQPEEEEILPVSVITQSYTLDPEQGLNITI